MSNLFAQLTNLFDQDNYCFDDKGYAVLDFLNRHNEDIGRIEEQYLDDIQSLQDQLKNAIVPKFKIGQEVWIIIDNYKIGSYIICSIEGLRFRYVDAKGFWCYEEDLFSTREEVEQRLKELRGDK